MLAPGPFMPAGCDLVRGPHDPGASGKRSSEARGIAPASQPPRAVSRVPLPHSVTAKDVAAIVAEVNPDRG